MPSNTKQKSTAFIYDPESDILAWEPGSGAISYGTEMGNVIIHFSEHHAPVLIEVLEATKLLGNAAAILETMGIAVPSPAKIPSGNLGGQPAQVTHHAALPRATPRGFSGQRLRSAIGRMT
ncbi:MAG: DUF2283 domain-containing protein [Patescibacteria group bacterium]